LVLTLRYDDPDYGFSIDLPGEWQIAMCGPRFVAMKSRDLDVGYYLQLMDENPNMENLSIIVSVAFQVIFGREPKNIEFESLSAESISFNAEIYDGANKYAWFGICRNVYGSDGRVGHIISSLFYNKSYLGSEEEKRVAKLIVDIVKNLEIKADSFGLFHGRTLYYYDDEILKMRKWECVLPNNYRLSDVDGHGFVAFTDRVYLRIKAYYYPFTDSSYLRDYANQHLSEIYKSILGLDRYIILRENTDSSSYYAYTSGEHQYWRVLGHWSLHRYFDLAGQGEFHMVLEKLVVYPFRIEKDFLPIAYRIFSSFITGPAWLSEETGLQISMVSRQTSFAIPSANKSYQKKTPTKSFIRRTSPNLAEKWRQKLREDLKRLYDWEERMWSEVYDTIKLSDTLSGMYTLEDKNRRTRLVNTQGRASPFTHTFWKPKKDPLWTTGTALAIRKPFRPKLIHEWEKLSWHWDKEKERLKEETKKKKQDVDRLFS